MGAADIFGFPTVRVTDSSGKLFNANLVQHPPKYYGGGRARSGAFTVGLYIRRLLRCRETVPCSLGLTI